MPVRTYRSDDVTTWWQRGDQQLFLGDALDHTSGVKMSVGFARYRAGEANPWTVSYDEALVITRGTFTVETAEGSTSAGAGEVIYLPAGTELVYRAEEDTELVYVAHPHWFEATERSPHAARLDEFHPATGPVAPVG